MGLKTCSLYFPMIERGLIMTEYDKIAVYNNVIDELKKQQSELIVGDPKIMKLDNVIIRVERKRLYCLLKKQF